MAVESTASRLLIDVLQADLDHYSLLGIKRFEGNPKIVEQALCRRVTEVKDLGNSEEVCQILNRLVEARNCLVCTSSKRMYDLALREATRKDTSPTAIPRPRVGRHLGNYELKQKIGSGGMGDVYLGSHRKLGRPVAIKVLANSHGKAALRRFHQESKILASLSHPNIIVVYDAGQEDIFSLWSMEMGRISAEWLRKTGRYLCVRRLITYLKSQQDYDTSMTRASCTGTSSPLTSWWINQESSRYSI